MQKSKCKIMCLISSYFAFFIKLRDIIISAIKMIVNRLNYAKKWYFE